MNNSLLIEVFASVSFSFTQGVTENYDPDEPETVRSSHSLSINEHRRINFIFNFSLHWPFIQDSSQHYISK
ncbi:hypothetical protein pdam_00012687 [Pocillopora damicornis]|uniref:Uncharacterized protein n=1 Tax=Pocillopora damicornis TaxID=46731 RepID=A0A3M6UMU6_POCDA|nr:hypothetical protein pdam_00012687 [Pocillopora damicornis]